MVEEVRCPYCGRSNVVKRGFRKLKKSKEDREEEKVIGS